MLCDHVCTLLSGLGDKCIRERLATFFLSLLFNLPSRIYIFDILTIRTKTEPIFLSLKVTENKMHFKAIQMDFHISNPI